MHMHKYMIGGIAAAVVGVMLVGWTTFRSYISVAVNDTRQMIKDAEPVEMKLKRAKEMLKAIDPAMNHNRHVIATEEVRVEKLAEQVREKESFLASKELEMKALAAHLKSGNSEYKVVGRTFTSDEVKADLAHRIKLCTQHRDTLEAMKNQLAAKERLVAASREKLQAMAAQKDQLRSKIELMEAKLEELKVAETTAAINIDGSELASLNELLDDVDTNLRVREKVATDANVDVASEIPVGPVTSEEDLTQQVDDYFKNNESAPAPVVEEGPRT